MASKPEDDDFSPGQSGIAKRPKGFWDPLNEWRMTYFAQNGKRPPMKEIERWYYTLAQEGWAPEDMPSLKDAWRHCKGWREPTQEHRDYYRTYRAAKRAMDDDVPLDKRGYRDRSKQAKLAHREAPRMRIPSAANSNGTGTGPRVRIPTMSSHAAPFQGGLGPRMRIPNQPSPAGFHYQQVQPDEFGDYSGQQSSDGYGNGYATDSQATRSSAENDDSQGYDQGYPEEREASHYAATGTPELPDHPALSAHPRWGNTEPRRQTPHHNHSALSSVPIISSATALHPATLLALSRGHRGHTVETIGLPAARGLLADALRQANVNPTSVTMPEGPVGLEEVWKAGTVAGPVRACVKEEGLDLDLESGLAGPSQPEGGVVQPKTNGVRYRAPAGAATTGAPGTVTSPRSQPMKGVRAPNATTHTSAANASTFESPPEKEGWQGLEEAAAMLLQLQQMAG